MYFPLHVPAVAFQTSHSWYVNVIYNVVNMWVGTLSFGTGLASSIPPFSAERDAMQYVVAIDGQGMHTSLYRCSITAFHPDAAPWPADAPVTPMTDHKGRRYECAIPPSKPPTDDTSAAKVRLFFFFGCTYD